MTENDAQIRKEVRTSLILLISAMVLFKFGLMLRGYASPIGSKVALITIFSIYIVAFSLSALAVVGVDMSKWGHIISLIVTTIAGLGLLVVFMEKAEITKIGTDAMLFSKYSVALLQEGYNPYSISMEAAFELYPVNKAFTTYTIDGGIVTSLSYPAMSILYYLPQAFFGVPNFNLTTIFILFLTLVYLISETPREYALVPFAVIFANPDLLHFSYGGVFDILWVLPILLAMRYWHKENWRFASLFIGIAFAVKQTPWIIAVFLPIWIYKNSSSVRVFISRVRICIQYGLIGFLTPNLPFIFLDPRAWGLSVLTPLTGGVDLVKQGIGLVAISTSGFVPLPKVWFTLAVVGSLTALLTLYYLYFERLKWLAWIAPMFILWFHYRSLQNYFIYFVPIGYYAILLSNNMVSEHRPTIENSGKYNILEQIRNKI